MFVVPGQFLRAYFVIFSQVLEGQRFRIYRVHTIFLARGVRLWRVHVFPFGRSCVAELQFHSLKTVL